MNVYEEIRQYVGKYAREIDNRFKEHNQAHTNDNIGSFDWDKSYYIRFNPVLANESNGFRTLEIPLDIEFGRKAGARPIQSHDEVLCTATELGFKLTNPSNFSGQFDSVLLGSIIPEPVLSNERWTKITLSVTINVSYEVR